MDTCRGEVLPYSPDVIKGLKAFKIGLCVAFGLASLSHVVISNIRKEVSVEKDGLSLTKWSDALSRFASLAVHLVPIAFIFLREWNGMHWDSFSIREERIQMWEESATLILFTLIILARSAATNMSTVFAFGLYIALLAALRGARDASTANVCWWLAFTGFGLLCVAMFRGNRHNTAEEDGYTRYVEYKSGANVLRGVFLLLAVFQLALHYLQATQTLDSELCALCGALLTGGVRHAYAVVCNDSSVELQLALSEYKYMYSNAGGGDGVSERGSVEGSVGDAEERVEEEEEVVLEVKEVTNVVPVVDSATTSDITTPGSDTLTPHAITTTATTTSVTHPATTNTNTIITTNTNPNTTTTNPNTTTTTTTSPNTTTTTTTSHTNHNTTTITASAPPPQRRHSTPYPLQSTHHLHVAFTPSTNNSPLPGHAAGFNSVGRVGDGGAHGTGNTTNAIHDATHNTSTQEPHSPGTHTTHNTLNTTNTSTTHPTITTHTTHTTHNTTNTTNTQNAININTNNTITHTHSDLGSTHSAFRRAGSSGLTDTTEASSRRQLLRYVFHEMRAPLNSISMAVDLLTHHSKKGTPKSKFLDLETLQIIEEATLTMERTLKDTMTLQKIDEGSLVAQLRIFSLYNMCDDIKDALKQVLRSNSVSLNVSIDAQVPDQIVGDHFRIRHVVAHVLSNAIKFSRIGGVVNLRVQVRNGVSSTSGDSMFHKHYGTSSSGNIGNTNSRGSFGVSNALHSNSYGFRSSSTDIGDTDLFNVTEYDLCPSERNSLDLHDEGVCMGGIAGGTSSGLAASGGMGGVVDSEVSSTPVDEEVGLRDSMFSAGSGVIASGGATNASSRSNSAASNISDTHNPNTNSTHLNDTHHNTYFNTHSTQSTPPIQYVVISITDNGVGMTPELQESDIFKPFNQLKTEESTGFRGTGLGLAICKKIITFLQGSITYSSVAGVGTTFKICFPLTLLDSESMDPVEEEDLPAIELTQSSDVYDYNIHSGSNANTHHTHTSYTPGMMVLGSPQTARHKAIARAKSFRGEKLLSILHNQSNVFDCPTPMSVSNVQSHSKLSSLDENEDNGGSGGGSGNNSSGISYVESPRLSPAPCIEDGVHSASHSTLHSPLHAQHSTTSDGERSPPRNTNTTNTNTNTSTNTSTNKHKLHSPPRPATRTLPGAQGDTTHNNSCSKILPGALSINTNVSPTSTTANSNRSAANNTHSMHNTHNTHNVHNMHYPDDTSPTFHSLHSLLPSPIEATKSTDDYITLTEKNVNLHILRTATDGIRALKSNKSTQQGSGKRKITTKEELTEMLLTTKILVVDDAPSNRKLLSMMLKRAGFGTVDLVEDGQAAVDYCKALSEQDQPRIIFMDNTMPRMTGIEASQVIRQGGYSSLIIGVTGNSLEEELDEFIASGADLVIVKPLKNQSLELLLGFIQTNGFDSSHGYRIDMVGKEYTWVPRGAGRY